MKKVLISLFVVSFIGLSYSQENNETKEVVLESVTVIPINKTYLDRVQDATMSIHIKDLENRVAQCDITNSRNYDGSDRPFEAIFKSSKGYIFATFDKDGKVLTTSEKFKNVKLPEPIRNAIFEDYPDWILLSDTYTVHYKGENDVKKTYKVKIGKGNLKKTFRIDFSDMNLVLANIGKPDVETRVSYIEVKN